MCIDLCSLTCQVDSFSPLGLKPAGKDIDPTWIPDTETSQDTLHTDRCSHAFSDPPRKSGAQSVADFKAPESPAVSSRRARIGAGAAGARDAMVDPVTAGMGAAAMMGTPKSFSLEQRFRREFRLQYVEADFAFEI